MRNNLSLRLLLADKDKEIERLKSRLEEYQEYVEINHKEIERLNNIINNDDVYGYIKHLEDLTTKKDNIINELEKELEKDFHTFMCNSREVGKTYKAGGNAYREHILLRLRGLKGSDK